MPRSDGPEPRMSASPADVTAYSSSPIAHALLSLIGATRREDRDGSPTKMRTRPRSECIRSAARGGLVRRDSNMREDWLANPMTAFDADGVRACGNRRGVRAATRGCLRGALCSPRAHHTARSSSWGQGDPRARFTSFLLGYPGTPAKITLARVRRRDRVFWWCTRFC